MRARPGAPAPSEPPELEPPAKSSCSSSSWFPSLHPLKSWSLRPTRRGSTWGVPAFAGAVAPVDAPVVERMRAAGAIAIGRTNLPDMGLRMHTESSLHGLTRNPWNPARTASGSSGGDAVALAAGMSALGLGNDIGGSLRNPASACGVASIRPSQGRVPHAGFIPREDTLLAVRLMHTNGPAGRRCACCFERARRRAPARSLVDRYPTRPTARRGNDACRDSCRAARRPD